MNNYCVYKHTSPNGKVYIGITSKNPLKRWRKGSGYYSNSAFFNAIHKYGWDNIRHEILFDGLTKEEACQKEIELIKQYDSTNPQRGYNITFGGEGKSGWVTREETKEKLRKALKGRIISEETRKKSSQAHKGYVWEKSSLEKMRTSLKGRKISTEARKKISAARKGTKQSEETKRKHSIAISGEKNYGYGKSKNGLKIMQFDKSNNLIKIWNCVADIKRALGISISNICSCCKNKKKTAGGYVWKYEEKVSNLEEKHK